MSEVKFIEYGSKRVLLMDFTAIADVETVPALVDRCVELVQTVKVRHSVLALMDLGGTRINRTVISSLKRLSENNGPYIKAMTFVGLSGMWRLIVSVLLAVTRRRNHRVFRTRSQALEWLIHR